MLLTNMFVLFRQFILQLDNEPKLIVRQRAQVVYEQIVKQRA